MKQNNFNPPSAREPHLCDRPSLLRNEIATIAERFGSADKQLKAAADGTEREEAERERMEAAGEFWAASNDLAQLFLLMLRHALKENLFAYISRPPLQVAGMDGCTDTISRVIRAFQSHHEIIGVVFAASRCFDLHLRSSC